MNILDHRWGLSRAADRVWAQVSGLPTAKTGCRLLMPLQAFIDDSYDQDGTFVLAGHIASAEQWALFSRDWEEMLPHGTLKKNGKYHFKMMEMAQSKERLERVPQFFKIVERHVLLSVSCKIDISHLKRALARVYVPGVHLDHGFLRNAYLVAFRCLMDMFHNFRLNEEMQRFLPLGEKVDFIFDNQTEKAVVDEVWNDYINERPDNIRELYGANPRFEDDTEFLPLQAADLWAWWVRTWYNQGQARLMETPEVGGWKSSREDWLKVAISFSEDQLVTMICEFLRAQNFDGLIYDVRFSSNLG